VHLAITIPTQLMIWRWPSQNTFGMWTVLYWKRSSRTQFGVSITVWRLARDTLNITCNFLYCNHQVHRDYLIALYEWTHSTGEMTSEVRGGTPSRCYLVLPVLTSYPATEAYVFQVETPRPRQSQNKWLWWYSYFLTYGTEVLVFTTFSGKSNFSWAETHLPNMRP